MGGGRGGGSGKVGSVQPERRSCLVVGFVCDSRTPGGWADPWFSGYERAHVWVRSGRTFRRHDRNSRADVPARPIPEPFRVVVTGRGPGWRSGPRGRLCGLEARSGRVQECPSARPRLDFVEISQAPPVGIVRARAGSSGSQPGGSSPFAGNEGRCLRCAGTGAWWSWRPGAWGARLRANGSGGHRGLGTGGLVGGGRGGAGCWVTVLWTLSRSHGPVDKSSCCVAWKRACGSFGNAEAVDGSVVHRAV